MSAFKGAHRSANAALGQFVRACEDGRVPKGSFLVIENLDRLSREDVRTAVKLWLDILDHKINIVQLSPERVFRHDKTDMTDVMLAVIELSRGHSESAMKSERVGKAWAEKKELARKGEHILTNRLPAWIARDGDVLKLIPEHATVIRRIFKLAADGFGNRLIIKKLAAEKVKPMSGAEEWCRAFVNNVLRDRRALGEHQPCKRNGAKDGPPMPNYYPPCVSEAEYFAALAAAGKRRSKPGSINRVSKRGKVNVFAGKITNWRNTTTYFVATKTNDGKHNRVLENMDAVEGRAKYSTFPYPVFEQAILSQFFELNPADVIGHDATPDDLAVAKNELKWVRDRTAALKSELLKGDVTVVVDALRELEKRESELNARVEAAKREAAAPLSDAWAGAREIIASGSVGPDGRDRLRAVLHTLDIDPVDSRVRLRSALQRVVSAVRVLFLPVAHRRDRIAFVKVEFASGGVRDYVIYFSPPKGNAAKQTPGRWWCRSIRSMTGDGFVLGGAHPARTITGTDLFGKPFVEHTPARTDEGTIFDPNFVAPDDFANRLREYASGAKDDDAGVTTGEVR